MDDVLNRALWALLIIAIGSGSYWLMVNLKLRRLRSRPLGLEGLQKGVPAILYFTTPDCQPCKRIQRPTLNKLADQLGKNLMIIEGDASERSALADYWGVLSVPTTFIIDSQGRPRRVNHGVASFQKLFLQLEAAEGHRLISNQVARDRPTFEHKRSNH